MSVNLDTNKVFAKLAKRTRVGWSMSFDNIDARFEYVRHGGSWPMLLKNIARVKELFPQGQWGGIHAVYNIYNATRLVEFTKFAREQGLTIHWQSLYQPECLDPQKLGTRALELAQQEIAKLLDTDLCEETEKNFFTEVQKNLRTTQDLAADFDQHIREIEQQYHADQQGQFVQLWPELEYLCK
jgi:hypothetical protein